MTHRAYYSYSKVFNVYIIYTNIHTSMYKYICMYTPKFIARLPVFYMNLKRIFP